MVPYSYAVYKDTPTEQWPIPQLGQRVAYHSKVSGVVLPAIVTCTQASYDPQVGAGKLKPPANAMHVHLKVFSPGDIYDELDIGPGYGKGQWAPLEQPL